MIKYRYSTTIKSSFLAYICTRKKEKTPRLSNKFTKIYHSSKSYSARFSFTAHKKWYYKRYKNK